MFKKKSVINYGSNRSAKGPGGVWLPQGPFGRSTTGLQLSLSNPGHAGFSLNGGNRNIGGVGREMKMSKSGTPYRGTEAIGFGGSRSEREIVARVLLARRRPPSGVLEIRSGIAAGRRRRVTNPKMKSRTWR